MGTGEFEQLQDAVVFEFEFVLADAFRTRHGCVTGESQAVLSTFQTRHRVTSLRP
jgi:hypothetical protein